MTDVSIPIALSNVCLNIDQALVEVDFVEERLREAGKHAERDGRPLRLPARGRR